MKCFAILVFTCIEGSFCSGSMLRVMEADLVFFFYFLFFILFFNRRI